MNNFTEGRKMYKALDIAKWLIAYNFGKNETEGEDLITNLKLQKLLYYAQSASLAFYNKRLFEDKFEAWIVAPLGVFFFTKKVIKEKSI